MTKVIRLKLKFYYLISFAYLFAITCMFFILPNIIKLYSDVVPIWIVVVISLTLTFIAHQRKHFGRTLVISKGELIYVSSITNKVRWKVKVHEVENIAKQAARLEIYTKRKKYTFEEVAKLKTVVLELKKALNLSSD